MKRHVKGNVSWVGYLDWELENFHGDDYSIFHGSSQNAYLIEEEKTVLVDTVWAPHRFDFIENLKREIDLKKIDAIVVNHGETDHSGALADLLEEIPGTPLYCTAMAVKSLEGQYGKRGWNFHVVKTGDELPIGNGKKLQFVEMRMLHWPDSMVTYCPEEQILFSSDAFGQHYCCSKLFDDETEVENMLFEAQKYFANILMPYRKLVPNTVKLVRSLPLKMICSCHGCIWRSHIDDILNQYESWGKGETVDRVLVVFDTMWGGTAAMARAMIKGIEKQGMRVKLYRYESSLKADIVSDLLTAKGILIGSPTQNSGMMPTIGGFLTYLKGLKPTGKKAAAFGTYGWAGGAEKDMEAMIRDSGMELLPGYNVKWRPLPKELEAAEQYGFDFAEKVSKGE